MEKQAVPLLYKVKKQLKKSIPLSLKTYITYKGTKRPTQSPLKLKLLIT